MTKNYLEKMPFDYYDFFNQNYTEGMLRTKLAKQLYEHGFYEGYIVLVELIHENLMNMRAIARIPEPKRKKKK